MAVAEPEVVHTGNTPEKIAEYKIIYDYSQVGHRLEKEAELWFGYYPRPETNTPEYNLWRKWNDPRAGLGKGKSYMVQLGKCPIIVKATGELAISPTVFKQRFYKKHEEKIEAMFEGFRKVFADEMKPVVDVEAGVDVEEAGVDVEGPTAAMEQMKLRNEGLTIGDILGVKVQPYALGAKLTEVAKYGDKIVVAEEGELAKAMEIAIKRLKKEDELDELFEKRDKKKK